MTSTQVSPARGALASLFWLALAGCSGSQHVLDPAGPSASRIAWLWWLMLALGTLVWLAVAALTIGAVMRGRRDPSYDSRQGPPHVPRLIFTALGITVAILLTTLVASIAVGRESSRRPRGQPTIEVIGHQWWWEVRYHAAEPNRTFITANEVRIPVGERVLVKLTTRDVIHSFWVPNLQGKIDMIPGHDNTLALEASQAGEWRGQCAEYCGLQHAKMALVVVAHEPEAYRRWYDEQLAPAATPVDSLAIAGERVFMGSTCVACHRVRGTPANGTLGPDLTHLASRRTLAAGTLPNTRGHLAGWIVDPQNVKPGSLMPATNMDGPSLQALLAYLEGLR